MNPVIEEWLYRLGRMKHYLEEEYAISETCFSGEILEQYRSQLKREIALIEKDIEACLKASI